MAMRATLTRAVAVISAGLTVAALGATPAAAIADGTPASPGQYPFAVKLAMIHIPRPDGTFYDSACSAALISPTWIITAGHCFHDINHVPVSGPVPYATTATLNTVGGDQHEQPALWTQFRDLLSPPPGESTHVTDVQQSTTSDIALARLSRPVANVSPLGLSDTRPPVGAVLTVAGWGAISGFIPSPRNQLAIGQVRIQTVNPTTITVLGAYPAADTSACMYDSGAPYFTTPTHGPPLLASTESTGPNCPHTSAETTARVDTLTRWIKSVVPDLP